MRGAIGYCSWCFEHTFHDIVEECLLTRNVYKCQQCKNLTLKCRVPKCRNMTSGRPGKTSDSKVKNFVERFKEDWNSEYCAEHDGTVASFRALNSQLDDIENYEQIFKRSTINFAKVGKITGIAAGGAIVALPLAVVAAPMAAAAMGSLGLLGTAGTGTAIASLHGAALTSASLAAIGGGTMAGGVVVLSAAGAALGAAKGAVIANAYFGEVNEFKIRKLNEGRGPAVIFVNGFLQEKEEAVRDWRSGIKRRFSSNPWYHTKWESKTLSEIGKLISLDSSGVAAAKFAGRMAMRASKKAASKVSPAAWAALVADLVDNPWHTAMVKASMTGALLADLMARTRDQQFILMGHSLGARVIYYALQALSTRSAQIVTDVYLFGGAVDRRDEKAWANACTAVKGTIFNCYTSQDSVLGGLYRSAHAFQSDPIGLGPIAGDDIHIKNVDCSGFITGHMKWKIALAEVIEFIEANYRGAESETGEPQDATPQAAGDTDVRRCRARTMKGQQCKRPATEGSSYCWQHR